MTDPTKPDEKPPVVIPLLPDTSKTAPSPPARWYMLRSTTIIGCIFFALGVIGLVVYMTTDKDHLKEHVFLWVSVGFVAAGWHLISRQSLKNALSDFGKFIPFGNKNRTDEPTDGSGG